MASYTKAGRTVQWIDATGKRRTRTFSTPEIARRFGEDKDEEIQLLRDGRLSPRQVADNKRLRLPLRVLAADGELTGGALGDYRAELGKRPGRKERAKHVRDTAHMVGMVLDACGLSVIEDLDTCGPQLGRYFQKQRRPKDQGGRGWSARTHNAYLQTFRSFCRYLINRRDLEWNPAEALTMLDAEADPRRPSRHHTVAEAEKLLAAVAGTDRGLYVLLRLRTGLRQRECLRLRWSDFDFTTRTLSIRREVAKNGKPCRLPLTDDLVEAMLKLQADALRDGRPLSPDQPVIPMAPDSQTWKALVKRARITYRTDVGQVDQKALRHSFNSFLLAAKVDLTVTSLLMRHTPAGGMRLTLQVYGGPDVLMDRMRDAVEQMMVWYNTKQVEQLNKQTA